MKVCPIIAALLMTGITQGHSEDYGGDIEVMLLEIELLMFDASVSRTRLAIEIADSAEFYAAWAKLPPTERDAIMARKNMVFIDALKYATDERLIRTRNSFMFQEQERTK
ncbi:MAG: hypothetical protein OXQ29_07900 [Rhodospirillaceae bacterium]|nr:hypothetical protein [Rhodospirillaceae bacterium]